MEETIPKSIFLTKSGNQRSKILNIHPSSPTTTQKSSEWLLHFSLSLQFPSLSHALPEAWTSGKKSSVLCDGCPLEELSVFGHIVCRVCIKHMWCRCPQVSPDTLRERENKCNYFLSLINHLDTPSHLFFMLVPICIEDGYTFKIFLDLLESPTT